jgi:8-oxo-dGTP diphosphatase
MAATRDNWMTTPLPAARAAISIDRTYTAVEFERLKEGHVPQQMEDKWFTFYEVPWLYLHRSWTGFCVYQVRFEPVAVGARVAEVLVSRDADQYRGSDSTLDALLLGLLLDQYAGRDTKAGWEKYTALLRARRDCI